MGDAYEGAITSCCNCREMVLLHRLLAALVLGRCSGLVSLLCIFLLYYDIYLNYSSNE